jgi:ATP adenylyltransferase
MQVDVAAQHVAREHNLGVGERPLWAPWRIEYVTAPKDGACIFCAAARASEGDPAAAHVLERGERCFIMLNAFPYASGHLMVAPSRHVAELDALEPDEAAELMRLAQRGVVALRQALAPDGFNLGVNLGDVAGAGFKDHLHLHVVPRWRGDTNFMPLIAATHVMPQALDATARLLRQALDQARGRAPAPGARP